MRRAARPAASCVLMYRAGTPSAKVRASAFAATTPSAAAAVPDDGGTRRRDKSSAGNSALSVGDAAGAAAFTVGLFASTASDAPRLDSAGPLAKKLLKRES